MWGFWAGDRGHPLPGESWESGRSKPVPVQVPVGAPAPQEGNYFLPTLLRGVSGESEAVREETARRIPGATSHTVSSAGHFLSFDAPEDVSAKVLEFAEVAFRTP